MKPTLNEKFLAYLALLSGLTLSAVAEYYSILGLTSIFAAAIIPVVVMGIVLGLGKVTATLWLKQNWSIAPWSMRIYLAVAIIVLMLITSMGIFGFLSKAHSDQNLVSGDVLSKIAVYDEKIKTSKENIDANRKALKQLDEAVDQVMARSDSEKGADKAVAVRKAQTKERTRLQTEITVEQAAIVRLNEDRAPIAAEVRKVEAEVGPIKYIAAFVYGNTDPNILERAVTWVIIILIVVFDPLAVILLLSSQISFQDFRERENNKKSGGVLLDSDGTIIGVRVAEGDSPGGTTDVVDTKPPTVTEFNTLDEPVREEYVKWPGGQEPLFCYKCATELVNAPGIGFFCPNKECDVIDGPFIDEPVNNPAFIEKPPVPVIQREESKVVRSKVFARPPSSETLFVQNEEQQESNLWSQTTVVPEQSPETEEHRRDVEVNKWARAIKNKEAKMTDVPAHIILEVRARV